MAWPVARGFRQPKTFNNGDTDIRVIVTARPFLTEVPEEVGWPGAQGPIPW